MRLRIHLDQCRYDKKKGIIEIPAALCVGVSSDGIRIVGKKYRVDWKPMTIECKTFYYDGFSTVNASIHNEELKELLRDLKVIIV